MGLVPTTYKSWELILQVLHQVVQDETCHRSQHYLTTHQCRWEGFFPSGNCFCKLLFSPLWMEHFVTQDEFSHPWKCFQAVSKQVYSSFQTHRKVENGTSHGKRKEITPLFEKKKTSILSTLPPMILFLGPQGRKGGRGSWPLSFITVIFVSNFQVLPMSRFSASFLLNVFVIVDVGTNVDHLKNPNWKRLLIVFFVVETGKNESMRWKPLKNEVDTLGWW